MSKALPVKVHPSGSSRAFYMRKEWAKALRVRKGTVLWGHILRGKLIITRDKPGLKAALKAARNGSGGTSEAGSP